MTTEIRELYLTNDKRVFIEVEIADDARLPSVLAIPEDLPPGAEPTGILTDAFISMKLFQENVRNMAESVERSLQGLNADEWSVELSIGFTGKVTPIPYIASGELEGGIKVTATWKKDK